MLGQRNTGKKVVSQRALETSVIKDHHNLLFICDPNQAEIEIIIIMKI